MSPTAIPPNTTPVRMRPRRSLLGPVLLLGLGTLFLLDRLGRLSFGTLLSLWARWWPMLLVLAGLILLAEWVLDHRLLPAQVSLSRRRIGGGTITLIIVLAVMGTTIAPAAEGGRLAWMRNLPFQADDMQQFLGERHEIQQVLDETLATAATLAINNPRGNITITGQSTDAHVHIVIVNQIYAFSDADARSRARQLDAQLSHSSDGHLSLDLPTASGASSDLTITVPANTRLAISAGRGEVHLSALKADVNLNVNRGDVTLNDLGSASVHLDRRSSSLTAHNLSGPLNLTGDAADIAVTDISGPVTFEGDFYGDTHLERLSGPITFHTSRTTLTLDRLNGTLDVSPHAELSGDNLVGPVLLNTRSRNIMLTHLVGGATITNSNGSVALTLSEPSEDVTVNNRSGEVDVSLPASASATVYARTSDGHLNNAFGGLPASRVNSADAFEGTLGTGKGHIVLSTSHADIHLSKLSDTNLGR